VQNGFVVDSLPRTGSTTLARLLNCHPDIKCLIEPFHPRRYNGQFHQMVLQARAIEPVLNLIWHHWNGIKHAWEAPRGWPFPGNPQFNENIALGASHVILLERRNLLRRYISGIVSAQLNFWIGTKQEFHARLEEIQLKELDPSQVLDEMKKDKAGVEHHLQLVRARKIPVMHLFYEDLFEEGVALTEQLRIMNDIVKFLGFREVSENSLRSQWALLLDRDIYQWASAETYRMIPGIESLDTEIGSNELGWLFPEKGRI
jgi:hypothetical protein